MDNFIGNNAQLIIGWGQVITGSIILMALFLLYLLGKNNKYLLPKGLLGYALALILTLVIAVSSLAFRKVVDMKPRISQVLNALEGLHHQPAPPFQFHLLDDDAERNITDYKGKTVLLNYWATWCGPCIREMPELNRLQQKYQAQGLVVIALSDEDRERLVNFAEKHPFTATAAYSDQFTWADIQTERPMTFLVNSEGIIVDYFTGGYDFDFFESKILGHLKN